MKNLIKNIIQFLGYQLIRLPTEEQKKQIAETEAKKILWLKNLQPKTILDIGANTGQFAKYIHEIFPGATLYSFEPLENCYNELVQNFAGVSQFQAFKVALGNEGGQAQIYANDYSPSSSLLEMKELHKDCFPYTQNQTPSKINIARLDDISDKLTIQEPVLIKIDVQGFEDKVIEGGIKTIKQATVLIVEMSIEKLYEHQPLFNNIYNTLLDLGFTYKGNYEQLHNPQDGRILQVDGIFIKA